MSEPREKRDLAAAFSDELRAFRWETHRTYIYSLVFYTCGLALGSVLYRQIRSDTVNALLRVGENRFLQLFLNDFACIQYIFGNGLFGLLYDRLSVDPFCAHDLRLCLWYAGVLLFI